jgi:tetratricopeptide (TPR) repeat protein
MAEAVTSLQRCVALDPANADAWANLGGYLNELGHPEDGLRSLERALALQPRDPIAWWQKAQCEIALGRRSDAMASLNQVLAHSASAPDLVEPARSQLRTLEHR